MHRWIARFLLLLTLAGYVSPLARAATAAPAHACCIRKAVHRCHDSQSSEAEQLVIHDAACCNNNCGRSVVTARWAPAQRPATAPFAPGIESYLCPGNPFFPKTNRSGFLSTRAPPYSPIA